MDNKLTLLLKEEGTNNCPHPTVKEGLLRKWQDLHRPGEAFCSQLDLYHYLNCSYYAEKHTIYRSSSLYSLLDSKARLYKKQAEFQHNEMDIFFFQFVTTR